MGGELGTYRGKPKEMKTCIIAIGFLIYSMAGSKTIIIHNNQEEMVDQCDLEVVECVGVDYAFTPQGMQDGGIPETKPQDGECTGRDHIEALIRHTFGEESATAIAIAKAESGLDPNIVSEPNKNGTRDVGLFQVNDIHKMSVEDRQDPVKNIEFAKKLHDRKVARGLDPWSDWSAYNSGKFKKYLQ